MTNRRQPLHRFVRALRDIDYAQRRVFELRTGVTVTRPDERR